MPTHDMIPSTLGHGETMCRKCNATNRELAVLGLDECDVPDGPVPAVKFTDDDIAKAKIVQRRALLISVFRAMQALKVHCSGMRDGYAEEIDLDDILEEFEATFDGDIAGQCEECGVCLVIGEQGHRCLDGSPIFCAEHAYTWLDVKESYEVEDGVSDNDPPAFSDFMALYDAHIARGGKPEDKVLHTL